MHKKDSKSEIKAKFKLFLKHSYMNVFLVFAMVLVTGVLFNAPTSAQDQMPGFPGETSPFSQDDSMAEQGFNQEPNIISFEPDKPGPQEAGSSIKWTVRAADPENDPLSYMFRYKRAFHQRRVAACNPMDPEQYLVLEYHFWRRWKIPDQCMGPRSGACGPGIQTR